MHHSAHVLQQALRQDLCREIDTSLPGWSVDSSPREVQCFALWNALVKKHNNEDSPTKMATDRCLQKFLEVNQKCFEWEFAPINSGEEEMLNQVKMEVERFWFRDGLEPLVNDYQQMFDAGRAGPGASLGASGCDFYTKFFDGKVTSTPGLHETWRQCSSKDPRWAEAERLRSERYPTVHVDASNYSFVNKNVTVARGICTEPSINMWFQLGLGRIIEDRLASVYGVRIRGGKQSPQPDVNRVLAFVGSQSGSIATLDLESASDSISLSMLKWLLPRGFYGLLCQLRCGMTKLPNGRKVPLGMVSTMGNGFTFPLETLIFSAVVVAVAKYSGVHLEKWASPEKRTFAVFGDDIICPTELVPRVIRVLNLLGFVVNSEKSFVEGAFRESCGADFFNGVNVRGIYLKRTNSLQDVFVAINRLNCWTARTGVPLPNLTKLLFQSIRVPHRFFVPFDESDDAGIKVPRLRALCNQVFGYNGLTHMMRYKAHVSEPPFFEFPTEEGQPIKQGDEKHKRHLNIHGAVIAFLNGSVRGYRVTLRQRGVRYTTRWKLTPRWDYFLPRPLDGLSGPTRVQRLKDAVSANLF